MHLGLVMACVAAVFLVASGSASAHTLPVKTARKAVKRVTADWYNSSQSSDRYWVDGCRRRSKHRINCLAHIEGYNAALDATETCTRKASARYSGRNVKASLADKTTCKFDYFDDGPPDIEQPAAPDTEITSGPAEGSTVSGQGPVSFEFVAHGAENPSFECSTDGAEFVPCSSGNNFGFSPGPHTFRVRAISNRLGTTPVADPTPASRSFTVA